MTWPAHRLAFLLGAMCMGLLALGSPVLADGAPRVVLLAPSESDPTVVRLRRELKILGIEVELVPAVGEGRRSLADVAREHHAPAAVALEPSAPALVLWIDPSIHSGEAEPSEIRLDEDLSGSPDHRLLVLRGVEILRERLLPPVAEVPDAGAATAPDLAADAGAPALADPPPSPPAPPRPRPSVFLGPALLASPGGVAATPHVWLGARWAPLSRLELQLAALVPTTAATVSASEGSMALRAGALDGGVSVTLTDPAASFFAGAGAGLGAMLTAFAGRASPPWQSASGLSWALLPDLHATAGYWVAPRVALRADLMTGFALPEPVLWIAGRRVAVFGEPAAVFATGIEVRL